MRAGAVRIARGWLLAALGAALLLWTAAANGRPAVFTDTALYYSQGEYLFEALGLVSPAQAVEPPGDPTALPARPGAPNISASIDRARSLAYGAPLYLLQRIGGLWLAAAVQALAVSGMIYLLYRAACPQRPRWGYLPLMAGLALLSPLPFFAGFIMPDVFAGAMGCGLLLLLVYPDRLGPGRRAGVLLLTAYALAVHRSNLLDAALVSLAALPLLAWGGVTWRAMAGRLGLVAGAAALAVAAGALLEGPVQSRAGEPIGTPPFLSARVLADGPGQAFLRQACRHGRPYELCRFAGRPMASSDQVLWSIRRRTAVFLADDPAGRLRMEREDARFALAEAAAEPVAQGYAALSNALEQFAAIAVDDPVKPQSFYVTDNYWRHTSLPRILPGASACLKPCPPRVNGDIATTLEAFGLGLAGLALAWRLSRPDIGGQFLGRSRDEEMARLLTSAALVLGFLLANAVVCGALSGPFARYQARLVWLVPLAAALLVQAPQTKALRTEASRRPA